MIVSVTPARNEERFISKTLEAAIPQLDLAFVIDDWSTDCTGGIAKEKGAKVLKMSGHKYSERSLRICETINFGLDRVPIDTTYVLVLGGDAVIPNNYVSLLKGRMESDPMLVIASGEVAGCRYNSILPQGTRLVDWRWWRKICGGKYEERYGWETLLIYRAWNTGHITRRFRDLEIISQRPVGQNTNWRQRGKAMKSLGYTLIQLLWRTVELVNQHKFREALDLTSGYLGTNHLEAEQWLKDMHRSMVARALTTKLKSTLH